MRGVDAKLYVIPGSHACRTAILMLEHKGIPYRRIDLVAGLHPFSVRVRGFPGAAKPFRKPGERPNRMLGLADRLGTVPALRADGQRVQTNREIARFLDRVRPDPPLFPADAERRRAVEEAERWGDEVFQMAARRIALAGARHGTGVFVNEGGDGRLGYLLYRSALARRLIVPRIGMAFNVDGQADRELVAQLPELLDRIDGWIGAGILNGEELNAADFMIAPSIALLLYRRDLHRELEPRPAKALADRLLPEPAGA